MARVNAGLQREVFTISRELEYFSADELEKQRCTGTWLETAPGKPQR
jgi:hypothetical protein